MKKTKLCIICEKEMPKGMLNVCSPGCSRKHNANLKKEIDIKKKEKKEKLFNTLSITIKGVDDESVREELRELIEANFLRFLGKKQIVIKVKRRKLKTQKMSLKDKLDDIFSLYIRKRDKRCVICGSTENLNNGHYYSRIVTATRFDEINCNCQCGGCNIIHEHDREPYREFMLKKYGPDVLEELRLKYHGPTLILKEHDYRELIELYTNKLKEL